MAQKLIGVLKKIQFQILKDFVDQGITFNDEKYVKLAQSLLNASIDSGDTITGTEMPTTFLTCTLDWSPVTMDDLIVKITKGDYSIEQNLAATNRTIVLKGIRVVDYYNDTTYGGAYYGDAYYRAA